MCNILLYIILCTISSDYAASESALHAVRTPVVEIEYAVNEEALPLDSVRLWYTTDEGKTWIEAPDDKDRQSPIAFHAPGGGKYGVYVAAANAFGASGTAPASGTVPQLTFLVDYTPPVVQLQSLRAAELPTGQKVIEIQWSAIDAQFGPRPITLLYQRLPQDEWLPVNPDPLANTGRFDWRIPQGLTGAIAVKAAATDLGGHVIDSQPQVIDLSLPKPVVPAAGESRVEPVLFKDSPVSATRSTFADAKWRAAQLYDESLTLRQAGKRREAIARLREVVKLDAQRADAFADMGDLLYDLGDFERSLGAYDVALKLQPSMRSALIGAANGHRQRKEYPAAAARLRTLLHFYPKDADGWLYLGDIAIFQGDEVLAREYYTRASQMDAEASRATNEARQRLAMLAESSRGIHGEKK